MDSFADPASESDDSVSSILSIGSQQSVIKFKSMHNINGYDSTSDITETSSQRTETSVTSEDPQPVDVIESNKTPRGIDAKDKFNAIEAYDVFETDDTASGKTEFESIKSTYYSDYDNDSFNESDYDSDDGKRLSKKHPKEMWMNFSDEDYKTGKLKVAVPEKSLFDYLKVDKKPILLFNVPEKRSLESILNDQVAKNKGAFMCIEIGSKVFNCIPRLLKIYSAWFANQDWDMKSVRFNELDVPASAFKIIYRWMRNKTEFSLRHCVKVMQAAKFLKIDILVKLCYHILCQPNVNEIMAFDIYWSAVPYAELDELRHVLLSRVRSYFLPMVASERFQKMTHIQLISLIQLDTIGVNSEVEVFFAAIRWITHDPPHRLQHLKEIMKYIRFPFISIGTLFILREKSSFKDFADIDTPDYVLHQVCNDPDIITMVNNAITYMSTRKQKTKKGSIQFLQPRFWIYNPKCSYHFHKLVYPYRHDFTYQDFTIFIESLSLDDQDDEIRPVDADGYLNQDGTTIDKRVK